jgi:hypothetical protein
MSQVEPAGTLPTVAVLQRCVAGTVSARNKAHHIERLHVAVHEARHARPSDLRPAPRSDPGVTAARGAHAALRPKTVVGINTRQMVRRSAEADVRRRHASHW